MLSQFDAPAQRAMESIAALTDREASESTQTPPVLKVSFPSPFETLSTHVLQPAAAPGSTPTAPLVHVAQSLCGLYLQAELWKGREAAVAEAHAEHAAAMQRCEQTAQQAERAHAEALGRVEEEAEALARTVEQLRAEAEQLRAEAEQLRAEAEAREARRVQRDAECERLTEELAAAAAVEATLRDEAGVQWAAGVRRGEQCVQLQQVGGVHLPSNTMCSLSQSSGVAIRANHCKGSPALGEPLTRRSKPATWRVLELRGDQIG
jgi:cation transport regulator ChaC